MAPNSEESRRIATFQWGEETLTKEKQRAPIYNPEDYALSIKKWGRRPNMNPNNAPSLYSNINISADVEKPQTGSYRDYRNPMLTSNGSEMTLRQFGTVTELLAKLKNDLRLAYPSFIQEFVAEPLDGVTLLLELLRAIQLSQSNNAPGSTGTTGKISPAIQRRALLDELTCLQCLLYCCIRYSESIRKLTASSAGLFTLAVCIMSNVNKSRIIALQLLTKSCEPTSNGHSSVSEALSTLRLRFGEPVRFRFLVGMLTSAGGHGELLYTGMKFLNTFLVSSGSIQRRLYIQAELEQAGFDLASIKKNISINSPYAEQIFSELDDWEKHLIDAESLTIRLEDLEKENDSLRDKVLLLERRVQILQEEKGILISLEQCLKERCSELQDEVISLKSSSNLSLQKTTLSITHKDHSAPEDEGISSSERSITPEELERESSVYEICSVQNETLEIEKESPVDDPEDEHIVDEEETTIEEVIEELQNIINDAESEDYKKQMQSSQRLNQVQIEEAQARSKIQMRVDSNVSIDDSVIGSECEIVPSNLHPQPPRKTRSLVHLYIPNEDYYNKEIFFDEPTFTSDESSDSLLSASKCQPSRANKEPEGISSGRQLYNSMLEPLEHKTYLNHEYKSKSLDRVGDGLDAMVDIVVTEKFDPMDAQNLKSDSGVSRSTVDVCRSNRHSTASNQYENPKMFLPTQKVDEHRTPESRYYFPRIQEKKANNSFHIKRGHGNAGMYSGQNLSLSTIGTKKSDYMTTTGSRNSSSKLTDFPSGLY
ncbi:uncharacterized protein mwh isoform X2 [Atheta coriaria]